MTQVKVFFKRADDIKSFIHSLSKYDATATIGEPENRVTVSYTHLFGQNTRTAVVNYQRRNGLSADGIVGCATWRRLVSEVVGIGRTPGVVD